MPYLSTLLGKPVTDAEGNRVGRLEDLIASLWGTVPHPVVFALAIQNSAGLRSNRLFVTPLWASVGFVPLRTALLVLSLFLSLLGT